KLIFSRIYSTIPSQLYLASYKNPVNQQYVHWLWDKDRCAEVDREWGRYLILSALNCWIMPYDPKRFSLGVPSTVNLPILLARGLTLCTGRAARIHTTGKSSCGSVPASTQLLVYDGVIPAIAESVSRKLGQKLVVADLTIEG